MAIRMTGPFRFGLKYDSATRIGWISDEQRPAKRDQKRDFSSPAATITEDYALISRFTDATTGQLVLVVSGLHAAGTLAAVEFLTQPLQPAARSSKRAEVVKSFETPAGIIY
jgi:hypothetical protein